LTIAEAVASGEDWIGFEVPKRRRVLYIDGEMPLADLKQRLKAIGVGRSDRIDILASEILFQDLRPLNIHLDTDRQQITEMLFSLEQEGRRPALIIFDNLSALRAGVDENDNAALDGLLRWFLLLRHRGYSILLIHHSGKGGDQRGASRLEDFLDTTIKLDRPLDQQESTGASFNLSFTKTRGPGFKPAELRLTLAEDEDGILRWRYAEAQRREASDETLKAIHYGPKKDMKSRFQTQQHLAVALKVQKSTISKHLKSLRQRGLVAASTSPIMITEKGINRLNALGGGSPK